MGWISHFTYFQNVESKGMRDQRLDHQRRATETSDDDLIPFGDRPTVSRFGAISRTSKTIYPSAGPMQAMAPQGAPTKPINISGKILRGKSIGGFTCLPPWHHPYYPLTTSAFRNLPKQQASRLFLGIIPIER